MLSAPSVRLGLLLSSRGPREQPRLQAAVPCHDRVGLLPGALCPPGPPAEQRECMRLVWEQSGVAAACLAQGLLMGPALVRAPCQEASWP